VQPRSHILVTVYFFTHLWQMINLNMPAYISGCLTPLELGLLPGL